MSDWDETLSKNNPEAFRKFISQYPTGQYRDTANKQLNSLLEQIEVHDFEEAHKVNTYKSYTKFLNKHPNGKNANKAREMAIDRLVEEFIPDVILFIGLYNFPADL
jgi:hypothetical protein